MKEKKETVPSHHPLLASRSSRIDAIGPLSAPPSRRGWLRGGLDGPFMAVGVVPALVPAPALELRDRWAVVIESDSDGCSLTSPVETSR
jgi:hypothetical protein